MEDSIKQARSLNFGPRAIDILHAGLKAPQNPWDYFGRNLKRSWSYAYFQRLLKHDLIEICETPKGRRGTWYQTVN